MKYHNPVLLEASVAGLAIESGGVYVDATFGGGGHSRAILERLSSTGRLIAFDQDEDALANAIADDRFMLIHENFRYMKRFLRLHGVHQVDGILADFGVSSHQFDVPERGFSTRFEAPLDMRMSRQSKHSAYHVINTYSETQLKTIFSQYGELRAAGAMAYCIVEKRSDAPIKTSTQLRTVLKSFLPPRYENKILAQIYQAIRIEVNDELGALKDFLTQTEQLLKPGGRLSCIAYHSLEDRMVKRFVRNGRFEGEPERDVFGNFEVPFKRIGRLIVPSSEELKTNSRARSAKLRIGEKI